MNPTTPRKNLTVGEKIALAMLAGAAAQAAQHCNSRALSRVLDVLNDAARGDFARAAETLREFAEES